MGFTVIITYFFILTFEPICFGSFCSLKLFLATVFSIIASVNNAVCYQTFAEALLIS